MNGITELAKSKKGVSFGASVATVLGLIVQAGLPTTTGALIVGALGGLHILGQTAVDVAKAKNKHADPKTGL